MKLNKQKLNLALCRACKTLSDLRAEGLSPQTLARAKRGEDVKTSTLGKIARALGVDPVEIIEQEEE